uniref:Uncharacterized protein n=1 Tax=Poecilia mexicana TaxID=48701 RepID=A0A3B3Y644_9TELE
TLKKPLTGLSLISFCSPCQHFNFWNVKGLNHPVKRRKVFSHIKRFITDVAFLQETLIRSSDGGLVPPSVWRVSILISQRTRFEAENVVADEHGRFIIVSGKLWSPWSMFTLPIQMRTFLNYFPPCLTSINTRWSWGVSSTVGWTQL